MKKLYFAFAKLYCLWGRIYRFFQRRNTVKYLALIGKYKAKTILLGLNAKWKFVLNKMTYKSDTTSMLGDVISDPYYSLENGGDDCDGFASVARVIFGESFFYNYNDYRFEGLFSCVYKNPISNVLKKKATGHMIALWKSNSKKYPYICVSTYSLIKTDNFSDIISALECGNDGWVFTKFKVTTSNFFDVTPVEVYYKDEFVKLYN